MNDIPQDSVENVDSRETGLSDFVDLAHSDLFHKTTRFAQFLKDGRSRGYETYVRHVSQYTGGSAMVDDEDRTSQKQVVMMCAADYLGLARHPQVSAAAKSFPHPSAMSKPCET